MDKIPCGVLYDARGQAMWFVADAAPGLYYHFGQRAIEFPVLVEFHIPVFDPAQFPDYQMNQRAKDGRKKEADQNQTNPVGGGDGCFCPFGDIA